MAQAASLLADLPVQQLFLLSAALLSLVVVRRLSPRTPRWGDVLRRRFVLGVPWGTALTILGVCCVYWFLQGGWQHPRDPLTIPFYSWSYLYPLGLVTAPFAHSGLNHVTGNLLGTVAFAPIVEYAWSHYPTRRGSQSFASLGSNPFVRIAAVPAGAVVVGLFTSAFALGPVIGFSGVVFAFAGFAFVTRPIVAALALVGSDLVGLVYRSLRRPWITAEAGPGFNTPWFANVAIQGHAIGVLAGVCLGLWVLRRRDERPTPLYLWAAALLFAVEQNLWAVYLPQGASRYVLFRAVGLGLAFLLTALIVAAAAGPRERFVPVRGRLAAIDLSPRKAAVGTVIVALVALSLVAVPFNLATVEGAAPEHAETIEVRDYTVTYVEDAPNQYATVFDTSAFGDVAEVRSSGVVVYSEQRRVWLEVVSKGRLRFDGRASIEVGGVGWRETVFAAREGWSAVGGGSTYKVSLRRSGDVRRLAYTSEPAEAEPTIDGRNVSIQPIREGFEVVVSADNETIDRAPVPIDGNETRVGGLTINRTDDTLFAISDGTRVRVANKEVPQSQQD